MQEGEQKQDLGMRLKPTVRARLADPFRIIATASLELSDFLV